ncbi:MAG: ribosome assembly RNA-binding protein YhbY [Myxococcota bacterium]
MPLTSRQARYLRSLAHHLNPVVRVGGAGVTDAVVDKTDKELEIHELVKIRIDADREEVRSDAEKLASGTRSEIAQVIGKIAVLYRRRSEKPTLVLPE